MAQNSPRMSMNTPSTTQQREKACRRLWYEVKKAVVPPVTMRKAPMKIAPWCREGILIKEQNCSEVRVKSVTGWMVSLVYKQSHRLSTPCALTKYPIPQP